ncbi:MAG: hypothetical protein GC134_05230 [Proteobacteria bacterium]|nr:hypothetical protein [Pseudomonadota bacterium]
MTDSVSTQGVGGSATITASQKASDDASVNFDTFIKLMVAQLQNQDPLNPLDGTQFTEQIATFSSLEQQIATNSHLEKIAQQNSYGAQSVALGMMGKEVLAPGESAELVDGKMDFAYNLEESAVGATLEILNKDGEVVKTFEPIRTAGVHAQKWDGKTDDGTQAPDGTYAIRFKAYGTDGEVILSQVYAYGKVISVESMGDADSTSLLLADGRVVGFNEIGAVREPVVAQAPSTGDDGTDDTSGTNTGGDDSAVDEEDQAV